MTSIKERAAILIKAVKEHDVATFKRCRTAIVAALSDNDYMTCSTENIFEMQTVSDNLLVGQALIILLSDMSKSGKIYRRVVVSAMYCLIKAIIDDKLGQNKETVYASIFLLILFHENEDFIGAEYIAQGVRNNAGVAAQQFIGMTCVFYWMYKLSSVNVELDIITDSRLQKALKNMLLQMPDESTRQKVVNFEYNNFEAMLKSLPLDFELRYPGVPFLEPDIVHSKIKAMFNDNTMYFQTNDNESAKCFENMTSQHPSTNQNTVKHTPSSSNNSGCLSVIILVLIVSIFSII